MLVLLFGLVLSDPSEETVIIVHIDNGAVQGQNFATVGQGIPYYAFRGIPYAEPPVGDLRFASPTPKTSWEGVWDATKEGAACLQSSNPVLGDEDCLFINVYTPVLPSLSSDLLPTMVWIYGGGFTAGDSSYRSNGPDYFLEQNVVVVTFNYRLGLFGFLTTDDHVAPGNNGLKDQVLALKWVRNNIRQFGGNPENVTLAGQSAGSAAVSYHLQSPLSQGLFQRVIMESGVTLCLWALSRTAATTTRTIALELHVKVYDSITLLEGLRQIDSVVLQEMADQVITASNIINNPLSGLAIGPVTEPAVEGAFFTTKSYQSMLQGQFAKVPIMMGFNSLDGLFYNFNIIFRTYLLQYDLFIQRLVPIDMNADAALSADIGSQIKTFYFKDVPVSFSTNQLLQFIGDDQFIRPIRQFAILAAELVPVYLYEFSYEGGLGGFGNRTIPGVAHAEELGYLWVSYYTPQSPYDFVVRSRMVTIWSNFIKYGNPTPFVDPKLENVTWNRVDQNLTYLDIGSDLVLSQFPEKNNMTFWDKLYAQFGHPPYDTY